MLHRPAVLLDFSTPYYLGLAGQHCKTTSRENRLYGLMDSTNNKRATLLFSYNHVTQAVILTDESGDVCTAVTT